MADPYFALFPTITYANTTCLDISRRAKLVHTKKVNPDQYYPIEIADTVRADQLADQAYGDPLKDWLVYLNNNIIDPYYGYHLDATDFIQHINDTYGSIPIATQSVNYWRTAWPTDTVTISYNNYNTMPFSWRKYYIPVFGNDPYTQATTNNVLYYQQAYLDWRMNTNQIISWNITGMSGANSFAVGNVVNVMVAGNPVANATIIEANSTFIYAQHVTGAINIGGLQDAFNSNVTAVIASSNVVQINIPASEAVFWESLSFYDWEDERNTLNKYLSLLNPGVTMKVAAEIGQDLLL